MNYNYFLLKSGNGDTMKELTSYGVKDPVALMEAFHEIGQNAIINIV